MRHRPLPTSPPPGAGQVTATRPRLPAWLSVPVLVAGPIVALLLAFSLATAPGPTLLPLPTFLVLVAVFVWFDRLEPEPWPDRVHAMLWGATVAIVVAGTVNTIVAVTAGEIAATIVSAPLVEEAVKAAGLLWIALRRRLDSVTDGVVHAGWIGAGFAAVENAQYFLFAADQGVLGPTFVVRGVLSPFAHPLFTLWIGVTIARAVERGRSPWRGVASGYLVAVVLHAAWNGAAVFGGGLAVLVVLASVALFVVTAVMLVRQRRRVRTQVTALVPDLAGLYGFTPQEVETFRSWPRTLQVRRSLPRPERRRFDAVHGAVTRAVSLHARPQPPTPADQQRAVRELWDARADRPRRS